MILILENSIIEWINEGEENVLERVLWVDAENNQVVVINLNAEKPLPVIKELTFIHQALSQGLAIKRTVDPFAKIYANEAEIPEKYRQRRDKRWEIIKDIVTEEPDVYDEKLRGAMIREAHEKFGTPKKDIYKYLREYWKGGKTPNALLPNYDNSGAPGKERGVKEGNKRGRPSRVEKEDPEKQGINIDDEIKQIFRIAVQLYYDNKQQYPLRKCYQTMLEKHFNIGYENKNGVQVPVLPPAHELPTFGQFKYWYSKEKDLKKSLIAREGKRGFALRHRPVLGSSTQMAFGPGSIFQIDVTIADVYLVNSFDRTKIIGRPVIYTVIDVFSRMIVGMYVGLEGPNWIGAKMALANAFTDKVSFCAEYGIEISEDDWNCNYLPEAILADRGEIIGFNSDHMIESLNIKVLNTPPYRADWKGIVEQSFRKANLKTIHWLPGAVKERYRERGEKDHRLDATLDLHQFTKIMINTFLNHNLYHRMHWYSRDEFMIQDHVEPIPNELWRWGIENRVGHLREKPSDIIKLNLMPRDEATVTESGIRFKGMFYSCERALNEQWFEKARVYGNFKVPVAYDTRNKADTINLILNNGKDFEVCYLLERESRYKGRRLEEVLDLHEFEKLDEAKYQTTKIQSDAELNAQNNAIIEEAKQQTMQSLRLSNISNHRRVKNIRTNRKEEKERVREREKWDLGKVAPFIPKTNEVEQTTTGEFELTPKLTKQQSFLKMLKSQTKGRG